MEKENIGYCHHHEEKVDLNTFEYKGCWTCHYFLNGDILIDATEAASKLEVTETTIIKWIKVGKLNGRMFIKLRRRFGFNPPYKKYYIYRKSIDIKVGGNMFKKKCKKCGKYSFSSSRSGKWICAECGADLTDIKAIPAEY